MSASVHAGIHPPGTRQTTPWTRQTPPGPGRHPPRPGRHSPGPGRHPPGSRLQHMVYEQLVRILLECILVTPVCHSVHRGGRGSASMHAGIPPPEADTTHPPPPSPGPDTPPLSRPPPRSDSSIRSTSGRYASYWNAFFFPFFLKTRNSINIDV